MKQHGYSDLKVKLAAGCNLTKQEGKLSFRDTIYHPFSAIELKAEQAKESRRREYYELCFKDRSFIKSLILARW
jgi:hypothetical protein